MDNDARKDGITRRNALGMGASLMLPFFGQCGTAGRVSIESELFVFNAPKSKNLVLAVTFAANKDRFNVCIHANNYSWTINRRKLTQASEISERQDGRIFVGEVLGLTLRAGKLHNAVVHETSTDFLAATKSLSVWAEIFAEDGSRFRVGSPFVAAIVAGDPALSKIYRTASPAQDRVMFTGAFAERLSEIAAAQRAVADPRAHGRRLADLLLPDVITYRPELPIGFNFASQNGRHPSDETAAVVSAVLTGAATLRPPATAFRLSEDFPYFPLPAVIT